MKAVRVFAGLLVSALAMMTVPSALAASYPLPPAGSRLVGTEETYVVPGNGESLEAIAARYQVGLIAMLEANPDVDPFLPQKGMTLRIPTQMLLPDTPREGIVLNLAELRLFYYPKGSNTVEVYPIGIGRVGRSTPTMVTSIISKRANPTWTPTANTRKEYAAQGISLPAVVPAGPENPMGLFALRLAHGKGEYLIHGTNANFGIGMRVSAGCIRLRPDDIETLFNTVPVGTRVQVVNEPIKVSVEPNGQRYIEVHQPLSKSESDDPQTMVIPFTKPVQSFILSPLTNSTDAEKEVARRSGIPVNVTAGESN